MEDFIRQLAKEKAVSDCLLTVSDDDAGDGTAAHSKYADIGDAGDLTQQRSQLRKKAAAQLQSSDPRYRGRKISRRDLEEFSEEEEGGSGASDSSGEEVDGDEAAEVMDSDAHDEEDSEADSDANDEEADSDALDEEDSDALDEEDSDANDEEAESLKITDSDAGQEKRGEAVQQQIDLWDRVMEGRIKLQKMTSHISRLPAGDSTPQEDGDQHKEALAVLDDLGCRLCGMLPSQASSPSRKRKADSDLESIAEDNFASYRNHRNNTVTFWSDKTQLSSKKFKAFNMPILKQIEQILCDRDRLLRRTQVSREETAAEIEQPEEVFDDNDFYQRLLRQLIESKAESETLASSSQFNWLEFQKLKTKKKKKDVDTRASKGRKLRYNVHQKLVNFMAPRDLSTWSEEAKNDLFHNLFKMP